MGGASVGAACPDRCWPSSVIPKVQLLSPVADVVRATTTGECVSASVWMQHPCTTAVRRHCAIGRRCSTAVWMSSVEVELDRSTAVWMSSAVIVLDRLTPAWVWRVVVSRPVAVGVSGFWAAGSRRSAAIWAARLVRAASVIRVVRAVWAVRLVPASSAIRVVRLVPAISVVRAVRVVWVVGLAGAVPAVARSR